LFNNEIAVDIRIDSNNNLVSDCNIYANDLGFKIWQNSHSNRFYLNNFWRNNVDVDAQVNNTWDDGVSGNYWDSYSGFDNDSDGIWDTPYQLSYGNIDRYPLVSMILPDEITIPTVVRLTSTSSDDTPSFTWGPSVYGDGIKGYYVKIDNNAEVFIGDTTSWSSSGSVLDGVHTFYVRAETMDKKYSDYGSVTFLIDTTFIDLDGDGWSDAEEQMYGTDPEDGDNYPLDTDGDRVPDSLDSDDDNDGYSDSMESSYETGAKDSNSHPLDTDGDGVPDDDSQDGKYTGDVDDDDDYLVDTVETSLGSDPKDGSDVERIYLGGEAYYLVDVSGDGVYDILYNSESDITSAVEKEGVSYLVDIDGGGWDYVYNTNDGSVSAYEGGLLALPLSFWLILVIAVVITVLVVVLYVVRRRKHGELGGLVGKKSSKVRRVDRVSLDRISETKELLKYIQEDVVAYLGKLDELEDQLIDSAAGESEEEVIDFEVVEDVEDEVDRLLARLERKKED